MKKGQFTMIFILGLLLLAAVALVLVVRSIDDGGSSAEEPQDFAQPVYSFVSSCLRNLAKEGVRQAGLRGGHVSASASHPDIVPDTSLNYLEDPPGSGVAIPYWYHLSNNCEGGCVLDSEAPTLEGDTNSISSEVGEYIEENLDSCLNGFESFPGVTVTQMSEPRASLVFPDTETIAKLEYELEVVSDGSRTVISEFTETLPVDLKRMYDLAFGLDAFLSDTSFLERKIALPVLSALSMGSSPQIPPVFGQVRFGYMGPWSMQEVNDRIERHINDEMSKVALMGAANSELVLPASSEMRQDQNLIIPQNSPYYLDVPFRDLEVYFDYLPWWDLYLDISGNGASSVFISPQPLNVPRLLGIIPPVMDANYVYDMSYPVLIRIAQPDAFNGEGFVFQFAHEANIRNNQPINSSFTTVFIQSPRRGSLICELEQRNSGVINITIQDTVSISPVENSFMEYACGTESCAMGVTDEEGLYSSKFPLCAGGRLRVSALGYETKEVNYTTRLDQEDVVEIEILPELEIRGRVQKVMLDKITGNNYPEEPAEWPLTSQKVGLEENEEAVIILTRRGSDDYIRVVHYNSSLEPSEITLLPGEYSVQGYLIRDLKAAGEKVVIPNDTITVDLEPLNPFGGEEDYPLEGLEFNTTLMLGGITLGNVEISAESLQKEYVTFYLAAIGPQQLARHTDLGVFERLETVAEENRVEFNPRFTDS